MRARAFVFWFFGFFVLTYLLIDLSYRLEWNVNAAEAGGLLVVLIVVLHYAVGLRTVWAWTREVFTRKFWREL